MRNEPTRTADPGGTNDPAKELSVSEALDIALLEAAKAALQEHGSFDRLLVGVPVRTMELLRESGQTVIEGRT